MIGQRGDDCGRTAGVGKGGMIVEGRPAKQNGNERGGAACAQQGI